MSHWRIRCCVILVLVSECFAALSYANECDNLLLTLGLLSPSEAVASAEDAELSRAAKAYLRLVEHLLLKNDSTLDLLSRLRLALDSDYPVNPLADKGTPSEIQFGQAFEKMTPQISRDWVAVKQRLFELIIDKEAESDARHQSEDESRRVFVMDKTQRIKTDASVNSSPAWQVVGGRVYLAVGSFDKYLYLYEFDHISGQLKERGRYQTNEAVQSTPAWQVLGDRVFVAVGSFDKHLYLYELNLDSGLLEGRGKSETGDCVESSPAWQVLDDRVCVVVGSNDKNLHLYELNLASGHLEERERYETDAAIESSPSWQTIDDQVFVAVGSKDHYLYLLVMVKDLKRNGGSR